MGFYTVIPPTEVWDRRWEVAKGLLVITEAVRTMAIRGSRVADMKYLNRRFPSGTGVSGHLAQIEGSHRLPVPAAIRPSVCCWESRWSLLRCGRRLAGGVFSGGPPDAAVDPLTDPHAKRNGA